MPKKNYNTPVKLSKEGAVGGPTYHFDHSDKYGLTYFQRSSKAATSESSFGTSIFTNGKNVLKRSWFFRGVGRKVSQAYGYHPYLCSTQMTMYFDQVKVPEEPAATGITSQDENEEVCDSYVSARSEDGPLVSPSRPLRAARPLYPNFVLPRLILATSDKIQDTLLLLLRCVLVPLYTVPMFMDSLRHLFKPLSTIFQMQSLLDRMNGAFLV